MLYANKIFLGCNYSNKKIKNHFDVLKKTWEQKYPLEVILIDRQKGRGSEDLWKQIQRHIADCALTIFDVSGFKPNVILELGYALAVKSQRQVVISFDERRSRQGRKPEWQLSDIPQLQQIRYKKLSVLDKKLSEHLEAMEYFQRLRQCNEDFDQNTSAPEKYKEATIKVLQLMRDRGAMSDAQLGEEYAGSAIRGATLRRTIKSYQLARRKQGPNGRWNLNNSLST